ELLDHPGGPQLRLVALAEQRGDRGLVSQAVASERREPGPVSGLEQLGGPRPLHERVAPVEEHRPDRAAHAGRVLAVARKILWASLALAPLTIIADRATDLGDVALFVLAAAALVPLAWLICEATDHAGEHTGPGIGGFLNASFGNAPELIIALLAVADSLPGVLRGSLAGSLAS